MARQKKLKVADYPKAVGWPSTLVYQWLRKWHAGHGGDPDDVKDPPFCIMRRRQVTEITGLSCSAIYRAMSVGTFPRPVPIDRDALPRAD